MKVLITGSTGFLGRHVIDSLLKIPDANIVVTASNKDNLKKIYVENVNVNIKKNEEMILQINTLLEKFSTASGQKSDKLVFYNENTELNEVLKTKQALVYEIGIKREQLVNYENTIKKNSSMLNIKNTESVNGKLKLVLPLLLIFGFVLIRLFSKFYKSNRC